MKKLLLSALLSSSILYSADISINTGWNAVGTNSNTSLADLKTQLGTNLLEIQNQAGTKTYNSLIPEQVTQSFLNFETGMGYWVKVSNNDTLTVTEISSSPGKQ